MNEFNDTSEIPKWIWENRNIVLSQLQKIWNWFQHPQNNTTPKHPRVVVLGPGGVGKSTLGKILSGHTKWPFPDIHDYKESMKDETYSENTDLAIPGLLIPPGQRHQRQQLWKNHIANIENDQLDGLILLGSYGFHSLGEINLSTHKLWNGNLEQFRVDFQQLQAQDERDVANMITPAIKRRRRKFWVLHMLNKADIWWNQRNTVINNFAHSEPFAAIQEHMRERDRYETCATSLTMSNVVTRDGSVLFPRRPEFDQETQTSLQMKMIDTIAALQDWSDKSDD